MACAVDQGSAKVRCGLDFAFEVQAVFAKSERRLWTLLFLAEVDFGLRSPTSGKTGGWTLDCEGGLRNTGAGRALAARPFIHAPTPSRPPPLAHAPQKNSAFQPSGVSHPTQMGRKRSICASYWFMS